MARLSVTEKQYIIKKINSEFFPVRDLMQDQLIPLRESIEKEVLKDWKADKVRKNIDTLADKLRELVDQYRTVTGVKVLDIGAPGPYLNGPHDERTPLAREVKRRLDESEEAEGVRQLNATRNALEEEVMLAGYPEELKAIVTTLHERIAPFRKMLPKNGKRKALTTA
jgi:hypothetical protein